MKVPVKAHSKRTITVNVKINIETTFFIRSSTKSYASFELFNFKDQNSFDSDKTHPSILNGPEGSGSYTDKRYSIFKKLPDEDEFKHNVGKKYLYYLDDKDFTFSFENNSNEDKLVSNYFAYAMARPYRYSTSSAYRYVFTNGWNLVKDNTTKIK